MKILNIKGILLATVLLANLTVPISAISDNDTIVPKVVAGAIYTYLLVSHVASCMNDATERKELENIKNQHALDSKQSARLRHLNSSKHVAGELLGSGILAFVGVVGLSTILWNYCIG